MSGGGGRHHEPNNHPDEHGGLVVRLGCHAQHGDGGREACADRAAHGNRRHGAVRQEKLLNGHRLAVLPRLVEADQERPTESCHKHQVVGGDQRFDDASVEAVVAVKYWLCGMTRYGARLLRRCCRTHAAFVQCFKFTPFCVCMSQSLSVSMCVCVIYFS